MSNDIYQGPICEHPDCNVIITNKRRGVFNKFCSKQCRYSDPNRAVKTRNTVIKKYGYENVAQIPASMRKKKETMLERYGVEHQAHSESIMEKKERTLLRRYGSTTTFGSDSIKEKIQETNLKKYGSMYYTSTDAFKKKAKKTNLDRYGVENVFLSTEIQESMNTIKYNKYGTKYPMQNPNIHEKQQLSRYKRKLVTLPSGRTVSVQGYENYGVLWLLRHFCESDCQITSSDDKPVYKYVYDNKERIYIPDVRIKSISAVFEIKSVYTFDSMENRNIAKGLGVLQTGDLFSFLIFNPTGELNVNKTKHSNDRLREAWVSLRRDDSRST